MNKNSGEITEKRETEKMITAQIMDRRPVFWPNPGLEPAGKALEHSKIGIEEIYDAESRLDRFRPFFATAFPETGDGTIESRLKPASRYAEAALSRYVRKENFYVKLDSDLPVAGSIKARGGIYEILRHAEKLVLDEGVKAGLSDPAGDYSVFASDSYRKFFSKYHVSVGSTGNLGLSIGIISARLGFDVAIHMSHDAKEWKKKRLRSLGVKVLEYRDSYSKAVEEGRKSCEGDLFRYFVDDENSKELFLGYSVAALRLKRQLDDMGIEISGKRKMNLYLPCGVGGAPGGITFGIKHVFGDNARCFFAEPVNAPSVLLGFISGSRINTGDFGIYADTDADGLAVDSPSGLVLDVCGPLVDGLYTVTDEQMYRDLYLLKKHENIKIEVSAAAGLCGPAAAGSAESSDIHIAWLTGGSFVPDDEYAGMYEKGKAFFTSP